MASTENSQFDTSTDGFNIKNKFFPKQENCNEERLEFTKNIKHFHEIRGTPIVRNPKIGNQDIDLYELYKNITGRGGWIRVNNRNDWDEVISDFKLPEKCVNASIALKQIYIRYLDRYEKVHFHKEDGDRGDDDDDEVRHKKWSPRVLHNVPMSYNYNQHNIAEEQRPQNKLSSDLYRPSEYEKLILSLMSPLPNEQDFAINVCTLMSNESKHTLKIDKCPKLVDVLLAHAGVFHHYTMRDIFIEFYSKIRKHSLQSFWSDCLNEKSHILELSYEDHFSATENTEILNHHSSRLRQIRCDDETSNEDFEEFSNLDFLCLGRGLGTHDYIGQRVHQIASILRNLSFIDENLSLLSKNRNFIRFLIMSANICWGNVQHMSLDMLGNIAPELQLCDPTTDDLTKCLLSTIFEGLQGSDRAVIISCLEVLYKLTQKVSNEEYLNRYLEQRVYDQICLFLCLNDIMLLLYTLECIYSLSSLGERACNFIIQVKGVIDTLVSLVTVEAQSYGPDACILMRVVETVPGTTVAQQQSTAVANLTNVGLNQTSSSSEQLTNLNQTVESPSKPVTVQIQQQSIQQPNIIRSTVINPPTTTSTTPTIINQQQQVVSTANTKEAATAFVTQNTVAAKHAAQQAIQENEQFALAWLRATFEPVAALSSRVEQQDLYKMYINASSKLGRRGVVSPLHFPRCVRSVFGGSVGPNPIKIENNEPASFYEGIRIRPKPLAVIHKGSVVMPQQQGTQTVEVILNKQGEVIGQKTINTPSQQSLLVAQLCGKNVVLNSNQQQTPILQKVLTNQTVGEQNMFLSTLQHNPTLVSTTTTIGNNTPTTSSSLIKSLLANKVTTTTSTIDANTTAASNLSNCVIAPNINVHQVAQRQHLQKQKELALQNTNSILKVTSSLTPIKQGVHSNQIINHEKQIKLEESNWDPVPPLAPLSSGGLTTIRHIISTKIDDDSNSTGNNSVASSITSINQNTDSSMTSFEGILVPTCDDENGLKDCQNRSQVVTANKMLADLLDKKSSEPPVYNLPNDNNLKRKVEIIDVTGELQVKKEKLEENQIKDEMTESESTEDEEIVFKPSSKAADLYAELAASMLEDEDMEEESKPIIQQPQQQLQTIIQQQKVEQQQIQRQIIMSPTNSQQVILSSGVGSGQMTTQATATIKTETGYQTVPVMIQHGPSGQTNIQLPKQMTSGGQLIQPNFQSSQGQTQYVLTTNQHGQTIVMAQQQQQSPMHQTVLVTQTPQQQGTTAKTIIILQQNPATSTVQTGSIINNSQYAVANQGGSQQKMIMTTQQGQQVVVTQVPRPLQHNVVMNHPTTTTACQTGNQTSTLRLVNEPPIIANIDLTQPQVQQQILVQHPQQQQQHIMVQQGQQNQQILVQQAQQPQQNQQILVQSGQQPQQNQQILVQQGQQPQQNQQILVQQGQQPQQLLVQQGQQSQQIMVQQGQQTQPPQPILVQQVQQPQQNQQIMVQQQPQQQSTIQQSQPQQNIIQQPTPTPPAPAQPTPPPPQPPIQPTIPEVKVEEDSFDNNWLWVCDWRGCPKKKFRSATEVYIHTCNVHCPDNIDLSNAEIYCQWGPGSTLCDNLPRKRFSLMTHLFDRHCTLESFKAATQRRLTTPQTPQQLTHPVTIIKQQCTNPASDAGTTSAAMQAIKRHTQDYANAKDLQTGTTLSNSTTTNTVAGGGVALAAEENEGPVTKSIRLTAALILRNLVNYSNTAKRNLRFYEPHLAGVALSNVESSRTIAQVLFEMNE